MKNKEIVGKLSTYCKEKNITIYRLAQITGVSRVHLKSIDNDPSLPLNSMTIDRILEGTKKEFGKGLRPDKYLSYKWL